MNSFTMIRSAALSLAMICNLAAVEEPADSNPKNVPGVDEIMQKTIKMLLDAHRDVEAAQVQKDFDEWKARWKQAEERNEHFRIELKEKRDRNAALAKEIDEQQAIHEAYEDRLKALTAPDPVKTSVK